MYFLVAKGSVVQLIYFIIYLLLFGRAGEDLQFFSCHRCIFYSLIFLQDLLFKKIKIHVKNTDWIEYYLSAVSTIFSQEPAAALTLFSIITVVKYIIHKMSVPVLMNVHLVALCLGGTLNALGCTI